MSLVITLRNFEGVKIGESLVYVKDVRGQIKMVVDAPKDIRIERVGKIEEKNDNGNRKQEN